MITAFSRPGGCLNHDREPGFPSPDETGIGGVSGGPEPTPEHQGDSRG